MSVINKKPYIKEVIGSLTDEELVTLKSLIDGGEGSTLSKTLANITSDDKGVHRCQLELKEGLFTGYLLYNDTYCVIIAYKDAQALDMYRIHDGLVDKINEPLSILELRSELDDVAEGDGFNPRIFNTDNLLTLPDEYLSKLKVGDIINLYADGGHFTITVSYITDSSMALTYVDNYKVRSYIYNKVGGEWEYTQTLESQAVYETYDITTISDEAIQRMKIGDIVRLRTGGVYLYNYVLNFAVEDGEGKYTEVRFAYVDNFGAQVPLYQVPSGGTELAYVGTYNYSLVPTPTAADNGRVLKVVNGYYQLVAEE